MWQRQSDFTGELRVPAALHPFDQIPEPLSLLQEGSCATRQQNLRVYDAAPATVVMDASAVVVLEALSRAIGGGGNGRLAFERWMILAEK